jgi:hypothetical protein
LECDDDSWVTRIGHELGCGRILDGRALAIMIMIMINRRVITVPAEESTAAERYLLLVL